MHVSSLEPNEECPVNPQRVRAKVYVIGFIMTPFIDPKTGEEHSELFCANSADPGGLIPKWIINMTAKAAIQDWIKQYEKACIKFTKQRAEKANFV